MPNLYAIVALDCNDNIIGSWAHYAVNVKDVKRYIREFLWVYWDHYESVKIFIRLVRDGD